MKTIALIGLSALLLAADGAIAQSQAASPPAQPKVSVSCPMAGSAKGTDMMGAAMMSPGGMANMQQMHEQMQAMHLQMHDDMQAMHKQMMAMNAQMQAMHQQMMMMRQTMPKHH